MKRIGEMLRGWNIWKKRISVSLACIVVFVTVYSLVLPAITLDRDTADQDDGIGQDAFENFGQDDFEPDDTESDNSEADGFEEDNTESVLWPVTLEWPDAQTKEALKKAAEEAAVLGDREEIREIDYLVTASIGEEAGLPADVDFKAAEIEKDTKEYEEYYKRALTAVRKENGEEALISYARFFDIAFKDGEDEIEPEDSVSILIEYEDENELTASEKEDLQIIHFDRENPDHSSFMENMEIIETDGQVESIRFESMTFSVYGVIKTTAAEITEEAEEDIEEDKEGEQYTFSYSLMGGESILLSELLETACPENEDLQIGNVTDVAPGNENSEKKASGDGDFLQVSYDMETGDYEIVASPDKGSIEGKEGAVTVLYGDESAAVFEIAVTGVAEVDAGLATISTADGIYLPDSAEGNVEELAEDKISPSAESVVDTGSSDTVSRVFDISLNLTQEEQAAYEGGFQVNLTLPEEVTGRDFHLYHIHDGMTEELEIVKTGTEPDGTGLETVSGIQFVTESFSEFVLQYTVDFHWEVNGKVYKFSIPGGGFVSLQHLVEVLGIADNDRSSENASDDAGDGGDFSREKEIEGSAGAGAEQGADNSGTQSEAGSSKYYEEAINLNNAVVSEKTREFVADVTNVEFSNPDLVWAGKVDQESTVGGLKQANGLECEYSADLTGEQIDEINSSTVEGGDWALISMLPFLSEETLTVTMKNGDQFAIRVTDGQIKKTVIDARGDTWEITVTYGKDALIPDGSVLEAHLLSEDEEEYLRAKESVQKVNDISVSAPEKESVDPDRAEAEAGEDAESSFSGSSSSMMAFDISIVDPEGNIIEPKSEVSVSIALKSLPDGADLALAGQTLEVYHITENEGEETAELVADAGDESEGTVTISTKKTVAEFVTESFSVYTVKWGSNQQVRLHFVDESGQELSGVKLNGTTIDGSSVTINPSNPSSNLPFDSNGILDLTTAFTVDGKTLSSTHRGTPNDILPGVSKPPTLPNTNAQQPHSIIGNELKWSGSSIQYQYFYTNSDKAGSVWMNSGYRPQQSDIDVTPNPNPVYDGNISYGNYTTYDYFLVYSPDYVDTPTNGGEHGPTPSLGEVGKDKQLTPNNDGTYTLDLSVTTEAKKDEKFNDINIILVLDTSSSMRRDSQDRRPGESGYDGTTRRMILTADAIENFINELKGNNTTANPDAVEMELITFNAYASMQQTFTTDLDSIVTKVWNLNGGRTNTGGSGTDSLNQGTNWADGLRLAKETAINDDDPTFILFLTDGAPSEYWSESNKPGGNLLFVDGEGCYLGAREEGRALASTGRELYGVFSFGTTEDQENDYLGELLDYSYDDSVRQERGFYAQDGDELLAYLKQILAVVNEAIGHTAVNYYDGIALDTASTALKTGGVNGTLGSITYSKTGGTSPDYTVETNSDGSIKSFKVDGTEYRANSSINTEFTYNKISGGTGGTPITVTEDTATVYQCTVGSGDDAVTYTMPIATLVKDETTKIGDLNWDLSPLGILEDGATYKISFVVWPDQEAYNYVADLNNGKKEWGVDSTPEPVYGPDGPDGGVLYWRNGVKQYPNIVYYPDEDVYAAVTNTSQEVTYYVEDQITNEDPTYTGPGTVDPPSPNPMPLTATSSEIEKAWSVERNPGTMAQLLYDEDGHPTEFSIDYALFYDDSETPYTTMTLGWDGTKYDWEPSSIRYVTYNGHRVPVGMRWTKDFAIATGLMLSEARMDELGMDKSDPNYSMFTYGSTKYYILEPGHDYRIEEIVPEDKESWVTYEFDFISPDYHPMLVDGKLKNVIFTKDGNTITGIREISRDEWLASLKIENNLRGYICLDKVVVDQDGKTPMPEDMTKFEYRIELHNSTDPGPFTVEGSHVPWFGINDLYYHDENWSYYQAEVYSAPDPDYPNRSHYLTITTESGDVYDARCTNADGTGWDDAALIFDEDITGPTWVTYYDEENDQYVSLNLSGNQMNHVSNNYVWAELKINQSEYLSVANIPKGTTYIVTEADNPRYDFVGTAMPSGATLTGTTVSGTIIPDSDNHITYTNKIHSAAIIVKKVDEDGVALAGATFTLKRTAGDGDSVYDGDGVAKPGQEEDDTGTYAFTSLPDGTYSLTETSAPGGFTGMGGNVTFTVAGGRIQSEGMVKPDDVHWDGSAYTFTVTNHPPETGITVRKQWLDYFEDADDPGADEITLTLKRRIEPSNGKKLKVIVNAATTRGTIKLEKEILIENTSYRVSWNDNGEFQWYAPRLTSNGSPSSNDSAVQVADGIGNNNHGNPDQYSNNRNAIFNITNLGNATEDTVTVSFTYTQSGQNWDTFLSSAEFYNALSASDITFTPTGTTIEVETGEPVEDEEWSQEITLNAGNSWRQTLDSLPTTDGSGGTYYYYIVEETVPSGYSVSYSSNNEGGITSGMLTAYNKSETGLGSLHITKTIYKDGVMDTNASGTFYYGVYDEAYDSGAVPPQTPVKTGKIEVTAFGSATVAVDNLPIGKYYVYELTGQGGTPVVSGEEGIFSGGIYYDVTTTGSQAVVNENDPPTVHIINNYETTSVTATKTWVDLKENTSAHPTIYFKLYYSTENGDVAVNGADLLELPNGTLEVSWTDVPMYDENRTPHVYHVKEFIKNDDDEYVEAAPNGYVSEEEGLSITNTQSSEFEPKTSYPGRKIWVDSSNKNGIRPPSLTVTLWIDKTGNGPSEDDEIVMDGTRPMIPSWTNTGDVWTYSFGNGNLPIFDDDDHIIHYYAVEGPVTEVFDESDQSTHYYVDEGNVPGYQAAEPSYPADPDDPESLGITPTSYTYLDSGSIQHVPNDADINIPSDVNNLPFVGVMINLYGYNYHIWTVRKTTVEEKAELLRYFNDDLEAHNHGRPANVTNTRFVDGLPVSKAADGNVEFIYRENTYNTGCKVRINKGDGDTLKVGIDGSRQFTSICVGTLKYRYDPGQTVFKNSLLTEDLDVLKSWGDGTAAPDGAEVVITLKGTIQTEASGEDPGEPAPGEEPGGNPGEQPQGEPTAQETEINYASLGVTKRSAVLNGGNAGGDDIEVPWVYSWKDLPQYDAAGNRITWTASETGYTINGVAVPDAFAPSTGSNDTYELIVTNQIPKYGFEILKEDETTHEPLDGAQFTIQAVEPNSTTSTVAVVEGSSASAPETTDDEGKAGFTDLELGYYEVKEDNPPAGYVITGDEAFYVKVDAEGVKLLEKTITDGKLSFKEAKPDAEGKIKVGNVEVLIEGDTITFIVSNTPGAALPNAGGPGTRAFTILGSILILGAGVLLWRRRRLI